MSGKKANNKEKKKFKVQKEREREEMKKNKRGLIVIKFGTIMYKFLDLLYSSTRINKYTKHSFEF